MCSRNFTCLKLFCTFMFTYLGYVSCTNRELRCVINPGLNSTELDPFNIVHIIAASTEDTVHFLWSTYNLPSVIVARTNNSAELHINFEKLKSFEAGAIEFSEPPLESFGLTFTELWEFSDAKDLADVSKSSLIYPINMELFEWNDVNETLQCSTTSAVALLNSSSNEDPSFSQNGTFNIQFTTFGNELPADEFPHLVFTGNSTQMKISLNNLLPNASNPRYALELKSFSSPSSGHSMWKKDVSVSLDDEYSPGVFKRVLVSPPCDKSDCDSFLFWRPVCYTGPKPVIANSSEVKISDFVKSSAGVSHSLADVYFYDISTTSVILFNVSFGTTNDGFYSKTRYVSWTLMAGTGQAVIRGLSFIAIVLITIALGSLLMFILGGALYMWCRQCTKKDDDLLLSDSSIN